MKKASRAIGLSIAGALLGFGQAVSALTLTEVVSETISSNPQVQAARHEFFSREHEIRQARGGYLPTLDVAAGIGRQRITSPSTGDEEEELTRHEASASARQMLFDGFATPSEVDRQKARYISAYHEMQAVEENVTLRTTEVYLNLLRYSEHLKIAQETLQEHQNIHDQMVLRNRSGVGSKADLDQITARLALAETNVITAHNNFMDAQSNFYRVTGLEPQLADLALPTIETPVPESLEAAKDIALKVHPTMMSAGADVEAAQAQYRASASPFWPKLHLEADQRWDEDIDGVEGDYDDLVVALRLRYNLYNGGADKARRRQTAELLEEAKEVRGNTHREVVEGLRLSWSAYQAIQSQMKYLQMHTKAALDTKASYQKQFNIGRRTLLDLLNTENETVDARRALVDANYDSLFFHYRILNSIGQLVQEFQDEDYGQRKLISKK